MTGALPDGQGGPHAYVEDLDEPTLADEDRHHLARVLRLRDGDSLTVGDGLGRWRPARPRRHATIRDPGARGPGGGAPAPAPVPIHAPRGHRRAFPQRRRHRRGMQPRLRRGRPSRRGGGGGSPLLVPSSSLAASSWLEGSASGGSSMSATDVGVGQWEVRGSCERVAE